MKYFRYTLLVAAGLIAIATALYLQNRAGEDIRRFNFAPDSAPPVESFKTISADSDYSSWRGYGWLDASGPVETGKWPGDRDHTWESRSNLTVVERRSPDDLACSYATGPATFALDLVPGKYQVWVLSGDAGHLEYLPREPYRITVEGKTAYTFDISVDDFIKQFESPVFEDELSHADVWRQAVAPRFKWSRIEVDVEDGQLTVNVAGEQRDRPGSEFTGDYAHTEARSGPAHRFSGALNAMIVLPAAADASVGEHAVSAIDAWRQQNIRKKWPQIDPDPEPSAVFTADDHARGYTVFPVNVLSPVMPGDRRAHSGALIKLRATPGEFVPISFGITPLTDLGETRVDFNTLRGLPDTAGSLIAVADNLVRGVVRYAATPLEKRGSDWRPQPAMIVPAITGTSVKV